MSKTYAHQKEYEYWQLPSDVRTAQKSQKQLRHKMGVGWVRSTNSCRCGGSCPECQNNRKFFDTKRRKAAEQDMAEYESGTY